MVGGGGEGCGGAGGGGGDDLFIRISFVQCQSEIWFPGHVINA